MPYQLFKGNRLIVLPCFLRLLLAKDIWRNIQLYKLVYRHLDSIIDFLCHAGKFFIRNAYKGITNVHDDRKEVTNDNFPWILAFKTDLWSGLQGWEQA